MGKLTEDALADTVLIVEGKNDRARLLPLVGRNVRIMCTYGIPVHARLMELVRDVGTAEVVVFTDSDDVGRRIRGILRDEFPDALHVHTKAEYGAVEKTPVEYLLQVLEKHELARLPGLDRDTMGAKGGAADG